MQVSCREAPTLPLSRMAQSPQSYFRYLPFNPADITCLALPEIIADKIRACYRRSKARDIYDLAFFAIRPLYKPLIRRLAVLKLWQAGSAFDPRAMMAKFEDATMFDWDDLWHLVQRARALDPTQITAACLRGFAFLSALSPAEADLAADPHQRDKELWQALRDDLPVQLN